MGSPRRSTSARKRIYYSSIVIPAKARINRSHTCFAFTKMTLFQMTDRAAGINDMVSGHCGACLMD